MGNSVNVGTVRVGQNSAAGQLIGLMHRAEDSLNTLQAEVSHRSLASVPPNDELESAAAIVKMTMSVEEMLTKFPQYSQTGGSTDGFEGDAEDVGNLARATLRAMIASVDNTDYRVQASALTYDLGIDVTDAELGEIERYLRADGDLMRSNLSTLVEQLDGGFVVGSEVLSALAAETESQMNAFAAAQLVLAGGR